jgi:hypothetical protein
MNALVVFYEGVHDLRFLGRVLKTLGYEHHSPKIKDMIYPLNEYVRTTLREYASDEMKVEQPYPPVPTLMKREQDNHLIILYSMRGNTDYRHVKQTIHVFNAYLRTLRLKQELHVKIESFAYLFFKDADTEGISFQVERFKKELKEMSHVLPAIEHLEHNQIVESGGQAVGFYVFSHSDGLGNLEDIIIPLFEEGNEDMFQEARGFLKKYGTLQERHEKKAALGIVGQLENPGAANGVHIQKSTLLTTEKLAAHRQSQEIASILERMFLMQ